MPKKVPSKPLCDSRSGEHILRMERASWRVPWRGAKATKADGAFSTACKEPTMIRSGLLVALAVIITAFLSLCALLFPMISPGESKAHKIANLWAKILLKLTSIRVNVIGRENALLNKPQIFMANHQSDFDILIVLAHIPGQFRWIVKKELFKIPVFGKAMKSAGYIEIDRQNHEKAMKSIEEAAQKIREGKSVMTFPEGTRSKDGTIQPFKQGMFHLAIQAGVPIVPISIIGAHKILPKRSLKIKPGKITMVIGKPVEVTGYTVETRAELIQRVRGIIIRNFESGRVSDEAAAAPDLGRELP
jgi:1-acyl-sn-glycerol-3-phosphate acyltransferase